MVNDVDVPDVRNMVSDMDASDIRKAVNDIDVSDIKTTNIKEPVAGTQQGHIRSEIKADTQTALDIVNGDTLGDRYRTSFYGRASGNYKSRQILTK